MTSPFRLCLFFKQKINNVLMSYPIATHVKLVHRKDIFWIIVRNTIIAPNSRSIFVFISIIVDKIIKNEFFIDCNRWIIMKNTCR